MFKNKGQKLKFMTWRDGRQWEKILAGDENPI